MNPPLPCRHCGKLPKSIEQITGYGFETLLECDCFALMGPEDWVVKEWNRLNKQKQDENQTNR